MYNSRNNHYAISTHVSKQYRGDGIVARAAGYGIPGLRVDGNDALACYIATRKAREIALKEHTPVLLEAMTYRVGHHSTSDDSSAYRDKKEVDEWVKGNNPITRFRAYLKSKSWDFDEDKFITDTKVHILKSMEQAELQLKPPISEMFEDVYDTVPRHLQEQRDELKRAIEEHPEYFPTLKKHLPWKD